MTMRPDDYSVRMRRCVGKRKLFFSTRRCSHCFPSADMVIMASSCTTSHSPTGQSQSPLIFCSPSFAYFSFLFNKYTRKPHFQSFAHFLCRWAFDTRRGDGRGANVCCNTQQSKSCDGELHKPVHDSQHRNSFIIFTL